MSSLERGQILLNVDSSHFVVDLKAELQKVHHLVRNNLKKTAKRQEDNYNTSSKLTKYNEGDVVLLKNEKRFLGQNPKLQMPFEGPYIVTKKLSDLNYVLQLDARGKTKLVHFEKLKKCQMPMPKWVQQLRTQIMTAVADSS